MHYQCSTVFLLKKGALDYGSVRLEKGGGMKFAPERFCNRPYFFALSHNNFLVEPPCLRSQAVNRQGQLF